MAAAGTAALPRRIRWTLIIAFAVTVTMLRAADKPVSYFNDVVPVFKRSCNGCHHPGKLKADLDLTTHAGLIKGAKSGPVINAADVKKSTLLTEISGDEPSMPKEGDPLTKQEVALIERWTVEGAKDDTPEDKKNPFRLTAAPVYKLPPVISAAAYSPDGALLAVSGYHEVLLHKSDGSAIVSRLVGESPRIESIAFSPDGKLLAACGGAPSRFGEVQIWEVESGKLRASFKITADSLFGISFSPDGQRVAFGAADKSTRIIAIADGKELLKFDNHSDWTFATTFTVDGKRILSGSRDRAMKLIDASNGQFIDDINKLLEGVLCFARHPKEDQVVYGGDLGTARIYRMKDNQQRTAANNDVNMVKEFERQPAPIHGIAWSPNAEHVALATAAGEVRVYKVADGARAATLKGHEGAVFSVAFHPNGNQLVTGGHDGTLRLFEFPSGNLVKAFSPVPIEPDPKVAAVPTATAN